MTASLQRLFEYVATDQCVAFVGAGPSVEAGLPNWKELVEGIAAKLRDNGCPPPELYARMIANGQFREALGVLERACRLPSVVAAARDCFARSVSPGTLHRWLGALPFRAYLTTNFDLLLLAALRAQRRAPVAHENTRVDLAAVDLDAVVSHVRLHGYLDDPANLVLTERQYGEFTHSPDRQYYRTWLSSVLAIKKVVFVGYSMKDPDLEHLLNRLRYELDRRLPHLAILPDVSADERVRLWETYRVEVIQYNTHEGRHDELRALLELLASSLSGSGYEPAATPEILRAAAALWMWYRGTVKPGTDQAALAATRALIVGLLASKEAPVPQAEVEAELQELVAAQPATVAEIAASSVAKLVGEGLLATTSGGVLLTEEGRELSRIAHARVDRLFEAAAEHLKIRVEEYHLPEAARTGVAAAGLDALIEAAVSRGMDVRGMLRATVGKGSFRELLRIAGASAQKHGVLARSHVVAAIVARELSRPAESVRLLVDYLARASACLAVLGMDPDGQRLRQEFLNGRALILDSNVIIQLLAEGSADSELIRDLIPKLQELGVVLTTTVGFVKEAEEHLEWARRHVERHGELSAQVLDAARGTGAYDPNAFLEGFVYSRAASGDGNFASYVATVAPGGIRRALESNHGLEVLSLDERAIRELRTDAIHHESLEAILQVVVERGRGKTWRRADAEADALTWLQMWALLPEGYRPRQARSASLLSRTGFLRAVTREAGLEIPEPVVVRPEVLAEYVWSIQVGGPPLGAAADAVRSAYIQGVAGYIDSSAFERVFEPLIRQSEEVMQMIAADPDAFFAGAVSGRDWREIPPLDRPSAAAVLIGRTRDRVHELEAKLAEEGQAKEGLLEELSKTRKQNEKLQRIARYKEKQRQRQHDQQNS